MTRTDAVPTAKEAAVLVTAPAEWSHHMYTDWTEVHPVCATNQWIQVRTTTMGADWRITDSGRAALARYREEHDG